MTAAADNTSASPRWTWAVVAALLALYAGLALSASTSKGVSFDEGEELAVGYNIWLHQDFRMEGANGDLVKRWATLPYLISRPAFLSTTNPNWLAAQPYALGYKFLFESGNTPELLLIEGRAMMVLLGLATGLLVFHLSRTVFGMTGGLISLGLFALSPDMLAFGGVVSTDMSICLTLLGATWCVWQLLHRVSWGRLLAGLVFLPLLFLAKATALVIFPITVVLVGVKLCSRRPLEWRVGRNCTIQSRPAQCLVFFALFLLFGFLCWAGLWAHYDFRYTSSPDPANPAVQAWVRTPRNPMSPSVQAFLSWDRRWHTLPEGYLDGMELLLTDNETRESFMNGQWIFGGKRDFFPYAIWAKTSPVFFLMLILGTSCWWWKRRRRLQAQANPARLLGPHSLATLFYNLAPYLVLITAFLLVAIVQNVNVAHRYILPIYPPLYILAGGSLGWLWLQRKYWARTAVVLLLFLYAGDAGAIYPNYLAYFSPVVGGPTHAYQHLVESSLDWGMDLPSLKDWLEQHNPHDRENLYLSYFGTDDPDYYGIKSTRLPSFPPWQKDIQYNLNAGLYAISATMLQSFYTKTRGPWNKVYETAYQDCLRNLRIYQQTAKDPAQLAVLLKKYPSAQWNTEYIAFKNLRFGRLCAWLRHHRAPDANINHTILIWNLSQKEIDSALFDPPAELADAPLGPQDQSNGHAEVN
jgi:hypothetical protein